MKSGAVAVALSGLVVVSGLTYAFAADEGKPGPARTAKAEVNPAAVVQVDDLAEKPEKFKGQITLKAAVARVNKSKGVFSVIDAREFESCGEVDCAKHYLPVRFSGELPKPETIVRITGEVVKSDKGLVFEAKSVDAKVSEAKK